MDNLKEEYKIVKALLEHYSPHIDVIKRVLRLLDNQQKEIEVLEDRMWNGKEFLKERNKELESKLYEIDKILENIEEEYIDYCTPVIKEKIEVLLMFTKK